MYRHMPGLFRFGYRSTENHPGVFKEDSFIYKLLTKGSSNLAQYIQSESYDAVICTHVFAAIMLNETRKIEDVRVISSLVTTDYTCFPGAKEGNTDIYFVPHGSLNGDFECHGIDAEGLVVSGIPVRQQFYQKIPKEMAKLSYQIPTNHQHIVMSCGSMGCGPMKKLTSLLQRDMPVNCDLTIVCGTNRKLYNRLIKKYDDNRNIHIAGFVQNMSLLLDSADLYLTKPGGISVTEAAVKNLPMVFIDAVAGCELYNRLFFIRLGGAQTGANVDELADICLRLMEEPGKLRKMQDSLKQLVTDNAAQRIFITMEQQMESRTI